MQHYNMGSYDVAVIGAGHAGCEAGLAAARMGMKTLVLSIQLEAVALMACNPSIGGAGKGQLVREIDALGGEMGLIIDRTFIQSRMLNRAKGPAVHSPRAQADKARYHAEMKHALEMQPGLDLKQGEAVDIIVEDGAVRGVVLRTGAVYSAKAVIIATGTFLGGRVFIGESSYESGPGGLAPAAALSAALEGHGIRLRRFKTGTPARALAQSLNFDRMQEQLGDECTTPFSFMNDEIGPNAASCWLTYTNEGTHAIIMRNLARSSLYSGMIKGRGPRYCPSIEDKVNRFADKDRHQIFIEPEGLSTDEVYIQGMSTSMPEDVQHEFYRSISGLEDAVFARPGYSIEYDCIDPLALKSTLEYKEIDNLFCAGQFNGTSGYEEAAAQGLMAGINAALKLSGRAPFILGRDEAYIGVMIDDLITKGASEPYRIMTSRAEYRLVLRQDNAHLRLTEKGWAIGLASQQRYDRYLAAKREIEAELDRLAKTKPELEEANAFLCSLGAAPLQKRAALAEILRRPEVSYEGMAVIDPERPDISRHSKAQAEIQIKYAGYIAKQQAQIERFKKTEEMKIPAGIDYAQLDGIRIEAREKLSAVRPGSIGQASRVAGVNPADINVLMIHLAKMQGMKADGGPHAASSSGTTGGIGADAGSAGSGVAPSSPPAESGMGDTSGRPDGGGLAVPGSSEIAVSAVSEAAGGIGADAGSAGSGVAPSSPSAESGMGDTSGRPDGGGLAVPAGSGVDDVLAQGLADLGIACGRAQTEKLLAYMEQVLELNRHLNLTSITDRAQFIIKHILDSLVCCNWPEIKEAERVVDIGTGAGFPGVPLAILMPEKSFILVDSLEKRLNAINGFIEYININNVLTKHARAESLAHQADFRESFDVCISRAVSELPVLAEYCLPFVKPGGWLYAYKGEAASQEMTKAEYAINLLGGRLTSIRDSGLEQYGIGHKIVIVEKTGLTPARYPRQAGKPEKAPLGTVKK